MPNYEKHLQKIVLDKDKRIQELISWSHINTFSDNVKGINEMRTRLRGAFQVLEGEMNEIALPPHLRITQKGEVSEHPLGDVLKISKRENAPIHVFFGGHMDTVFPKTSPFQKTEWLDLETLRGPGVADMKGGLMVMLLTLCAFESSPFADKIGWHILLNTDEEIGSPSSSTLLESLAKKCDLGLLFEPAFPDGALAAGRKGSINFTVIAKGKAAHAGRDFHLGKNAISLLSRFILEAEELINLDQGITVNIGRMEGGHALNIVPDKALLGLNVRMINPDDLPLVKESLKKIAGKHGLEIHEHSERLPKPFDEKNQALFEAMRGCAKELGHSLEWKDTGGTCDGNTLFAAGLPNIDSLGPVGGNIHTSDEYIHVETLFERAKMVALFLFKLANGEIT